MENPDADTDRGMNPQKVNTAEQAGKRERRPPGQKLGGRLSLIYKGLKPLLKKIKKI